MNGNHGWQQHYQHNQSQHRQPEAPFSRVAADSVQDAQGLLAAYPMASVNPTNHVARHLSSMTLTAEPPSFVHPNYYAGNPPPPYTEYAQELSYLGSSQPPANDSGYWSHTRDEAVRLLGDHHGSSSYAYQEPVNWIPAPVPHSSFHTIPFAQSLFQRTAPTNAYPTPPPPGIITSSSSLAFALGPPPPQPARVYRPEESPAFFDTFLEQKSREMAASRRPVTPPPKAAPKPSQESPDPLALRPGVPAVPAVTPLKRKVYVQLDSPAVKRVQSIQSFHVRPPDMPTTPRTPVHVSQKKSATPSQVTPTPRRIVNMAYVSVPYKPWLTPSSSSRKGYAPQLSEKRLGKMKIDDTPDLGGYGTEDDDDGAYSPTRTDTVKSSARRTGERDDRVPLEKLTSLIDDIFEAEDALPPDVDLSDLPSEFFSPLTTIDPARPLLHANVIRKLTKNIGHVARPTKRMRTAGIQGTPRGKGRMAEVETQVLSRLLKMLERSVRAGEDVDPFYFSTPAHVPAGSPSKKSPKKPAKGKKNERRSKSRTPGGEEDEEGDDGAGGAELTDADYDKLTRVLEVAKDSIMAADCCIALLASDRLTKQLYSEELITACLSTIKNQLTKIVYPFVEASTELSSGPNSAIANSISPFLRYLILDSSSASHRRQLSEMFQALSAVLPGIDTLVNAESVAMSDTIIIQAVYIAIGPFFVVENVGDGESGPRAKKGDKGAEANVVLKTFGKSAMRGLRLDALALIRSIFANHEDQRSWIIEEILSSLIKLSDTKQKAGQFRLRDGRSIRTVSALLLQLVQTSAHDVRIQARKIEKARQNRFALKRQESMTESQANLVPPEPFLDDNDFEEIRLYGSGLDSATKAAKTIVLFLTQRSGKGKATKNSNEAEYRTIFDNLISDLLAVLYWPEWPAASLLLSIACKYMVSSLDDVKTSHADNNAAKTIALDHLGVIAARIRSSALKVQPKGGESVSKSRGLKPLDEIVSHISVKELDKLLEAHKDVTSHLCKRSTGDQAHLSARELTAATLGHELAAALKQVNGWITDPDGDEDLNLKDPAKLRLFGQKIKTALRDVWKDPATDVFDIGSQEEVVRIDRLAEEVGTVQSLRNSFQPILGIILMALDAPPIFMRTKALRALGQIVTSDATILATPNVRRSIESHLLDSSPAVRDAAVELIGKYMIDSPEVAGDYYSKIADRIADTGLSVRKRVIKLLKSFYSVTDDNARRIDIATRIVLRMLDEDETVKDLAIKTIEELWFPITVALPSAMKSRATTSSTNAHDKAPLLSKVAVIMGTSANFKDRQSPLEDLLHKVMVEKSGHDATSLHARYAEICETLIDGLVDASDLPGFTVMNCIRTIYLFTSAYPAILSGSNASTLLPYLKNATTQEEQATSDYLLKVFRASIPYMPKTAAKFGNELQLALQPMIIKPSGGGVQVLQETVACMCIVIQHLTHDFTRLVNLLKSCNLRLQQAMKRPLSQDMMANEIRALSILIYIVSLLGENCNFDNLRTDHPDLAGDINTISQGPIVEHIYNSLLQLYEKYDNSSLRGRILQCLGFLFRAQPTLMTMEPSSTIMDAIFASPEEEARGRLLKIMQEFLVSEAAKHAAKEKETGKGKGKPTEVNMDELVGNTDGFADSGVSSAIVQRYLSPILDAALSQHPQIQATAIDVLSFTIKQGLAHPLQSFPVIVALETSPLPSLSNRASALHAVLHNKHASLLNTRYTVSARASFDYQKKIVSGPVKGFRMQPMPVALLQRWYSLVREKRASRQDFLKALVKVFQENPLQQASQDDVDFTRYMAENFAAFDYKTQEEVFTVIKYLTTVLSTTGVQLLETVSPAHLLSHLHGPAPPALDAMVMDVDAAVDVQANPPPPADIQLHEQISLMRSSVVIAMVMLLKAHLKTLYSLSEDKCNKFQLGKKSAIGDKPAAKKHDKPMSWDRLPYATVPILTSEDVQGQKARFLEIWNEDGVTAEPEDEFL
ncbi:Protein rad9 [Hypsizygus marmoreus]|uniref:Sister chromatid cohesion protein n=1 Tax=Hypsizygus marmoreus TaxID=39966 RepID=A0A369J3U7_HYPMA|nr:Protein rad9 [Hypsizygus marmoreus]